MYFFKTLKSFAQAFSKACRSRATPLSLSAESETPLGFAQHLFFLKIGGFYPPIHFLLLATSGGEPPLPRRGIARQVSLDTCKRSLLTRSTKFPMNYRLADALPQDTQSLDQAFSKACSFQRQSLWSLSAESETLYASQSAGG